jgi:hypothetical protein
LPGSNTLNIGSAIVAVGDTRAVGIDCASAAKLGVLRENIAVAHHEEDLAIGLQTHNGHRRHETLQEARNTWLRHPARYTQSTNSRSDDPALMPGRGQQLAIDLAIRVAR